MIFLSYSGLVVVNLVLALTGSVKAFNPNTDPVLKAGRTLINSWEENGTEFAVYGYGTYQMVNIAAAPPPWASDEATTSAENLSTAENLTIWEWSNGTTLEVESFNHPPLNESLSVEERALEARVCKRSCTSRQTYYWGDETTGGTWFKPWKRTDAKAYNGGEVQYCQSIIIAPTFSGSIGISIGIISGSLGISPNPLSSNGYCYGCVSRRDGDKCSRLWYQEKMNWKQGNLWRHETRVDNGVNACSLCVGEYDRNILIGNIRSNWAVQNNGIPVVTSGCSPCSD